MSYIGTHGGNPNTSQALPASRYRAARPKRPQVALHTSESPAGQLLIVLWQFLNRRRDHGSYHGGVDVYGTRNQYAPWSWYTWHAPSVNPFACGLAANCRADQWDRISRQWRDNLIRGLAWLAHQYSRWCVRQGLGPVQARRLTRSQALRGESGFIYHGDLQSDRTDPTGPRRVFPWSDFLAEFRRLEAGGSTAVSTPTPSTPVKEGPVMTQPKDFWDHREHDFLNEKPNSYGFMLARVHQYVHGLRNLRRDVAALVWGVQAARDFVNGDDSANSYGFMISRIHQYSFTNLSETREVNAGLEAGFKALADQLDTVKPGLAEVVRKAFDEARAKQVDISAAEVAEQIRVDAKLSVKED